MVPVKTRLLGLLVDPPREWNIIAGEPADVVRLYTRFVLIVAAVPSLALLVGFLLAAAPIVGIIVAFRTYLVALASPILVGLVVERLAPRFHSTATTAQAVTLVAYSYAPAWVGGALYLVPSLGGIATVVGMLYGIYLFALGLPRLLHTPREQIVPFMVVSALVVLGVTTALRLLLSGSRGFPI